MLADHTNPAYICDTMDILTTTKNTFFIFLHCMAYTITWCEDMRFNCVLTWTSWHLKAFLCYDVIMWRITIMRLFILHGKGDRVLSKPMMTQFWDVYINICIHDWDEVSPYLVLHMHFSVLPFTFSSLLCQDFIAERHMDSHLLFTYTKLPVFFSYLFIYLNLLS